jgi:hypothetical protein
VTEGAVNGIGMAESSQKVTGLGRLARVARALRPPVLGLKQVERARTMLIE